MKILFLKNLFWVKEVEGKLFLADAKEEIAKIASVNLVKKQANIVENGKKYEVPHFISGLSYSKEGKTINCALLQRHSYANYYIHPFAGSDNKYVVKLLGKPGKAKSIVRVEDVLAVQKFQNIEVSQKIRENNKAK